MILSIHIIAAVSSLVAAGFMYIGPSAAKIKATNILTSAMFFSGVALVVGNSAYLIRSCVMGLALLGAITYATISARRKLAQSLVQK